jgi:hypothetical protein
MADAINDNALLIWAINGQPPFRNGSKQTKISLSLCP